MKNKILVLVIIILIPVCILVVFKNKNIDNINNANLESEIIVKLTKDGEYLTLNLDDYLIGVVGAEMPASFNLEALKAQAVASRTYALYNKNDNITTSTSEQAYLTNKELKTKWLDQYDDYYNKIKTSITSTENLVIKYNNNLIKSYYYAMSNGKTEKSMAVFNEDFPYLNEVDSSFDEQMNNFLVTKNINQSDFCSALNIDCNSINITNIVYDDTKRVQSISINNQEFSGIQIRKLLNLRSTDFAITLNDNQISITTKGYGHGVGMSQYGANYLANNGKNYEEILKYYYQNVEITKN